MTRQLNKSSGFTLLEMLVAMAITTILLTVVYGSFYQGIRSWHGISSHNEAEEQQYLIRQHLRQQLQNALPVSAEQRPNRPIEFTGKEDHIQFIAALSPLQGNAGLYSYQVTLQKEPAGINIQITPYESIHEESWQNLTLESSSALRIEYSDSVGSSANWTDRWPYNNRLPHLIKIYQSDTSLSDWPPLTIQLRRHRHAS
ncbi:prepilin-type N-terminal cleavage/methylation domain-containing protein [Amphritea japonica]|uniref:General secretion pathway protein J n=1 Tax=Amphritea japonica ATCC BAA-1530 TaxID=1278309 RepID=A0A7R6PNU4_9GAMM|nr:prepilin-type N-terminal cleavage/methylation domain-containing protein [Amphritea japonica]BBB26758.1 general secretion pathway protein J [Amphritea japonica ATCC BAA-1530]